MPNSNELIRFSDFREDTPLRILSDEQPVEMSVRDVLQWIAPQAPPAEALKFLLSCRAARLNPFLGEAYLIPMGPKWATVIAKAGYLKRAQQHPDYEGHEAGIIAQAILDAGTKGAAPKWGEPTDLPGTFLPRGYVVTGGWAKVYRRGLARPIEARVSVDEYKKDTDTWKRIACTMIRKVALVHAIREAFAIGDSYDEGEVDGEPAERTVKAAQNGRAGTRSVATSQLPGPEVGSVPEIEAEYRKVEEPNLPPDKLLELLEVGRRAGMTDYHWAAVCAKRGVSDPAELSRGEASQILARLLEKLGAGEIADSHPAVRAQAEGKAGPGPEAAGREVARDEGGGAPGSSADDADADGADAFEIPDAPRRLNKAEAAQAVAMP